MKREGTAASAPSSTSTASETQGDERQDDALQFPEDGHDIEEMFESDLNETIAEALNEDEGEGLDEDELEGEGEEGAEREQGEEGEEEGEGESGEQRRGEDGRYLPKEGEATPAAKAGEAEAAKGDTAPKWEPLVVAADRQQHAIEEAQITRSGGNVFLTIPEKDWPKFHSRMSAGIAGQRMHRQLTQALREVEAQRNAPPQPSDAEIEAKYLAEKMKPYMAEIFTPEQIRIMELEIAQQQRDAKDEFAKAEEKRVTEAAAPAWEEQQLGHLVDQMKVLATEVPELKGITREELLDVYQNEFLPVRNALIYRDSDGIFANQEYMVARLRAKMASRSTASAAAPAPSSTSGTPDQSTTAATGTGTAGTAQTRRTSQAERFNRGVDGAARTTSLKANRDKARPPQRTNRATANAGRRRPDHADEQARAEDDYRRIERAYLNSDSLDFDESDDEA